MLLISGVKDELYCDERLYITLTFILNKTKGVLGLSNKFLFIHNPL